MLGRLATSQTLLECLDAGRALVWAFGHVAKHCLASKNEQNYLCDVFGKLKSIYCFMQTKVFEEQC